MQLVQFTHQKDRQRDNQGSYVPKNREHSSAWNPKLSQQISVAACTDSPPKFGIIYCCFWQTVCSLSLVLLHRNVRNASDRTETTAIAV